MDYLSVLFPALESFAILGATLVTILAFAVSIKGSRFITIAENVITVCLFVAIAIFVSFGVPNVNFGEFFSNADGGFLLNGFGGFMAAIAILGWACQGTTGAISMAAVTEKPKSTIPKSILIVNAILAIIYALMAYVAAGILSYEDVAGQNISVAAQAFLPTALFLFFVVGGGICAVLSSMLGTIAYLRYPLVTSAEDGWYPKVFKKTSKTGYPYVIYLVLFVCTLVPILSGLELDALVSLTMIPTMLINICTNALCITVPKKYPEQWAKRSIRFPVWLWDTLSVLGVVFAAIVAYNLFVDLSVGEMIVCVIMVAIMLGLAIIRIRQGAVSREAIEQKKQEILTQAIADDPEATV